ncbi:unnamed protein product [Darwinula stevensoni]|uniref:CARD domain-containing protein n=1 Tax=Darwinula stevensoni TaxID=69355 RepID=A0A7R8XDH3_9CRUS|nr:unnamed protein product [Darwinula stevensoni]CAG0894329.1 unnamed protein product [Darwinula stevensoni]
MADSSEEAELHVDGKTVAQIIAEYYEDLNYIDHDAVLARLLKKQVITPVEHVEIIKTSQKMEKIIFIQEKLPQKGDTAFQKFLESLGETGQKKLAWKMRRQSIDRSKRDEVPGYFRESSTSSLSDDASKESYGGSVRSEVPEVDHPKSDNTETMTTPSAVKELVDEVPEELIQEMMKVQATEKGLKAQVGAVGTKLRKESKKESVHQEMEGDYRVIEEELSESRDEVGKLQLLKILTMEKKAKDLEEQLKSKQNVHVYGEKNCTIERQFQERSNQVAELRRQLDILEGKSVQVGAGNIDTAIPTQDEAVFQQSQMTQVKLKCRTKITTWNELIAFIGENQQNSLIIIHVYSHKSKKKIEAEDVKRKIVERISHAIFLEADLHADWIKDFFWNYNERKRSDYWIIVMSQTPADLWTICDLTSKWGCISVGHPHSKFVGGCIGIPIGKKWH